MPGENETGPTDPSVSVLSVEGTDGRLLGTLVHYACHPVILGPQSLAISADFVGAMRRTVEEATGAPVLFVQGACADINPRGMKQIPEETLVETLGLVLAKAAFSARAAAVPVGAAPIVTRAITLHLPPAASTDGPNTSGALPQLSRGGATPPPHADDMNAVMDERFPWSWEPGRDKDSGRPVIDLDISLLRCGDIAILGLSCEPFVEMGLAIKAARVFPETLIAGYSNGCFGYLPPAYTYAEGGYEVAESYRWLRLPAPPQPGSSERVAAEAIALLRDAAG